MERFVVISSFILSIFSLPMILDGFACVLGIMDGSQPFFQWLFHALLLSLGLPWNSFYFLILLTYHGLCTKFGVASMIFYIVPIFLICLLWFLFRAFFSAVLIQLADIQTLSKLSVSCLTFSGYWETGAKTISSKTFCSPKIVLALKGRIARSCQQPALWAAQHGYFCAWECVPVSKQQWLAEEAGASVTVWVTSLRSATHPALWSQSALCGEHGANPATDPGQLRDTHCVYPASATVPSLSLSNLHR